MAAPSSPTQAISERRGMETPGPARAPLPHVRGETITRAVVGPGRLRRRMPLPAPSLAATAVAP